MARQKKKKKIQAGVRVVRKRKYIIGIHIYHHTFPIFLSWPTVMAKAIKLDGEFFFVVSGKRCQNDITLPNLFRLDGGGVGVGDCAGMGNSNYVSVKCLNEWKPGSFSVSDAHANTHTYTQYGSYTTERLCNSGWGFCYDL